MSGSICEHDWAGDDSCAYCEAARLRADLGAATAQISNRSPGCWYDLEIKRLRARIESMDDWRRRAETAENNNEKLRADLAAANERVEFAESELSAAFGLPPTIGPIAGEAARIVGELRERAELAEQERDEAVAALTKVLKDAEPAARQLLAAAKYPMGGSDYPSRREAYRVLGARLYRAMGEKTPPDLR